jgi:25S rRNA (adenine2142-N1)-methyltransferase
MSDKRTEHSAVISTYHALLKRIQSVDSDPTFPTRASKDCRRRVLQAQLEAMGGLDAYQAASRDGEAHGDGFDASQWVLAHLARRAATHFESAAPLRLVDVGAIVARFPTAVPGGRTALQVRSIDLNPQHKDVERLDFFDLADGCLASGERFDVVVLSLVLNFVGSAHLRGQMLERARAMASEKGLLFLVLPLASVANSRHCDEPQLRAVLEAAGWRVLEVSKSAKLISIVCENGAPASDVRSVRAATTKRVVRAGSTRNNFCVLLPAKGRVAKVARRGSRKRSAAKPAPRAGGAGAGAGAGATQTTSNQRRRARRRVRLGELAARGDP